MAFTHPYIVSSVAPFDQDPRLKRLANHKRALLPMWLAVIAAQSSAVHAEVEPMRLASPRSCVSLLPPEAIERETIEQQVIVPSSEWGGAAGRLAMRERVVAGQIADAGSAVPDHLSSRLDESQTAFLVVCGGVVAGGLWLAFGYRRPGTRQVRSAGSRGERTGIDLLKPLIANSLPIIEETLVLPALARLHGRPIVIERYRLDSAHSVGDPHFVVPSHTVPIETDTVHWVSAAESDVKEPSYRRFTSSPLERALATFEGSD